MFRSLKGPRVDTGKVPLSTKYTGGKRLAIPCGRCIGCRLEKSRQWASRIVCETQMHESNIFLTLTYRDSELTYGVDPHDNQTAHGILVPRHLELFWKRLRKWHGKRLGYYACGEYGDKSSRPHYHACIFGLTFPDQKFYAHKNGNNLYSSDICDNIWTHGNCYYGDVTFESAAYVARYTLKKRMGNTKATYDQEGLTPEFSRMSRRPAIGKTWFEQYGSDVFPSDTFIVRDVATKPPRYFLDLLARQNLNMVDDIRFNRIASMSDNLDENEFKRLRAKERVKLSASKGLTRRLD